MGAPYQLPPGAGEHQHLSAAARQFYAEKLLQLLDLPGIQTLPCTVAAGSCGNAARPGNFNQGLQSVQG